MEQNFCYIQVNQICFKSGGQPSESPSVCCKVERKGVITLGEGILPHTFKLSCPFSSRGTEVSGYQKGVL